MQSMPNAIPITKIKNEPSEVLEMIEHGPVMLTNRGSGVAVIIGIDKWNEMAEQMEKRQFTKAHMDALAMAYKSMAEGGDTISMEELNAKIAERDRVASPA